MSAVLPEAEMEHVTFSPADLAQLAEQGLTEAEARRQLQMFTRRPYVLELARPATIGDGIQAISPARGRDLLELHECAAAAGRFVKFVPASGAASRMFQLPLAFLNQGDAVCFSEVLDKAHRGDAECAALVTFCLSLKRFAFFGDLEACLGEDRLDLTELAGRGRYREILRYLLTEAGLNYGALPKGLLKFHGYDTESRTALEEHLIEAAGYVRDQEGRCRLHLTISPEFRERFLRHLEEVAPALEERLNCRLQVSFSAQGKATDTIAADRDNRPFREADGRLHFRPGGHGALIYNLEALKADLVYIKNIDNVAPDRLKEATVTWKKILGGFLVHLEERLHLLLRGLNEGAGDGPLLREAEGLAREELGVPFPEDFRQWPGERRKRFLWDRLNRPLRVCGMVKNEGEPGGAPFWVREPGDEGLSLQIVEGAQVDLKSPEQRAVWLAASHFNPVDLVLAVRDWRGQPFKLLDFANPDAVFISRKYRHGRELKALELPGLWNGAMARWLTVFVEVPAATFNPVKTVFDLLRPEHLPE